MADNPATIYGFQWSAGNFRPVPPTRTAVVATGIDFSVNGTSVDFDLNPGDPITLLAGGTVDVCEGFEASGNTALRVLGIYQGCRYWDGTKMVVSAKCPSNVAWGTIEERRTEVLYIPAEAGLWEVMVDDASTATTEAGYRAFIGENCDHSLAGRDTATLMLNPRLDISTHVTTTAQWRIRGISQSVANMDFSGANVRLIVEVNESFSPTTDDDGI